LIFGQAPSGFHTDGPFDAAVLGPIRADRVNEDGRRLVVADASSDFHIWLQDTDAARRPAVILPLDGAFELRLDMASRLARRLRGRQTTLLPRALQLTSIQRTRLIQMLHAFDIHEDGGGPRDVAAEVLDSEQASLPSTEWKDSSTRRRAIRLIRDSIALVNHNYLKLLRGK
jgi:hypothetical protein